MGRFNQTVSYDPWPPAVSDRAPAAGATVSQARPSISAAFFDTGSGVVTDAVRVTLSGEDRTAGAEIGVDGFLLTPRLPAGEYEVDVGLRLCDAADNCAAAAWPFRVDTTTTVEIERPLPASSLGTLTTTVEGLAEDGARVTLAVDGDAAGSTGAGGGRFTFEDVPLETGVHTLVVTASDGVGNQARDSVTLVVDPDRPALSARAAPNPFAAWTEFTLRASAPLGDAIASWRLSVLDSGDVVTATTGEGALEGYKVHWDGRDREGDPLPDGDYGYRLAVSSTLGVTNATPLQRVTIDRDVPPTPTISYPEGGTYFSQVATVVSGTAEPGSTVGVYNDGMLVNTASVDGNGRWRLGPPYCPIHGGGWNEIAATATDGAGNTGGLSRPVTVSLSVGSPLLTDTVAVEPWLTRPGVTVTLRAQARGEGHPDGAPTAWVRATLPTTPTATTVDLISTNVGISATWQAAWWLGSETQVGSREVAFVAQDESLPPLVGRARVPLWVDGWAPDAPRIACHRGRSYTRQEVIGLHGRAEPGAQVTVYADGEHAVTTMADVAGRWAVRLAGLTDGEYAIHATATDGAGNVSADSATVVVTVDRLPPEIARWEVRPLFVRTGATVAVTAVVNDTLSGVAGVEVGRARPEGGLLPLELDPDGGEWRGWLAVEWSAEGEHALTARAADRAGNITLATTTLTVDNGAPTVGLALGEASPYAAVEGDVLIYGAQAGRFTVTATLTDAVAGLEAVVFPATVSAGGTYSLTVAPAATVSHAYAFDAGETFAGQVRVSARDRAGNEAGTPFRLERDVVSPCLTLEVEAHSGELLVTWRARDRAGLAVCTLAVREDGGVWEELSSACEGGRLYGEPGHAYEIRLAAADRVGNAASTEAQAAIPRVTKYYYHSGGQRVAMRVDEGGGDAVYYLHGDHLGSTSLVTDGGGGVVARQLYHPYGEVRHSEGTLPTDLTYTGQRDVGLGLMHYGARYYHPYLNRWIQPDTIIPDPANPQSLNRYSYVYNRPLVLKDPSGHNPIGTSWELSFFAAHGRLPTDVDRQDRLFSLIHPGSGFGGAWTAEDWTYCHADRASYWSGAMSWSKSQPGLNRFLTHVATLSMYYSAGEEDEFVRAIGLVWGGIPYKIGPVPIPTTIALGLAGAGQSNLAALFEGNAGWDERIVDDGNPSRHWAGGFVAGWNFHEWGGKFFNTGRELASVVLGQPGASLDDVWLGNIAAQEANTFWHDTNGMCQSSFAQFSLVVRMDEDLRFAGPTTCLFCQVTQVFWNTPAPPQE